MRERSTRFASTAALVLSVVLLSASAPGQEASLQDIAKAAQALPEIVIYTAKEIVTLDPAKPSVPAVAVVGDRILAVGLARRAEGRGGHAALPVDTTFASQVIVPGFIAQHDHPLLAALTMTSEIIAIEDWVLPQGTSKAAKDHADYLKRLAEANARLTDPNALLLTWGFHHYFHGKLTKADLDAISTTRPIIVWHRSGARVLPQLRRREEVRRDEGVVRQAERQREEAVGLRQRSLLGAGLVRGGAPDHPATCRARSACGRASSSSRATTTPTA